MKQRTRLACLVTLVFTGVALADQARAPTVPHAALSGEMASGGMAAEAAAWTSAQPQLAVPQVGQQIDPAQLHPVRRPGLYGVGSSPAGSRYGVVEGRLIRYDPTSLRVQSIIRQVDEILD